MYAGPCKNISTHAQRWVQCVPSFDIGTSIRFRVSSVFFSAFLSSFLSIPSLPDTRVRVCVFVSACARVYLWVCICSISVFSILIPKPKREISNTYITERNFSAPRVSRRAARKMTHGMDECVHSRSNNFHLSFVLYFSSFFFSSFCFFFFFFFFLVSLSPRRKRTKKLHNWQIFGSGLIRLIDRSNDRALEAALRN